MLLLREKLRGGREPLWGELRSLQISRNQQDEFLFDWTEEAPQMQ